MYQPSSASARFLADTPPRPVRGWSSKHDPVEFTLLVALWFGVDRRASPIWRARRARLR
jgi:hypothetical protein